jgi:RNA polymerase sigma-70 factor, ECF subfamily
MASRGRRGMSTMHDTQISTGTALTWPHGAPHATTDRDLLDRIVARDRVAIRTLYIRHNVGVYRFVLRLIGDKTKAEDIVSEVFFDVWRKAGSFEARKPWDEMPDDDVAVAIIDQADDLQIALDQKDTHSLLSESLKKLSPEHREIVDLVYYHEKSVKEAAEVVGLSRSTVKTRMFYARKRIAEHLDQEGRS